VILVLRDGAADGLSLSAAADLVDGSAHLVIFARPDWKRVSDWWALEDTVPVVTVGQEPKDTYLELERLRGERDDPDIIFISPLKEDFVAAALADADFAESLEEAAALVEEGVEDDDEGAREDEGPTPDGGDHRPPLGAGDLDAGQTDPYDREAPEPPRRLLP
jgi:hypothetical protein